MGLGVGREAALMTDGARGCSRRPRAGLGCRDGEDDVLAFFALSTNQLERFNREIGQRTDVVGVFPDDASVIRLVSMLAIEANDEWLVGRDYISQKSMAPLFVSKGRAEDEHQQRTRGCRRDPRGLSHQTPSPTNRARTLTPAPGTCLKRCRRNPGETGRHPRRAYRHRSRSGAHPPYSDPRDRTVRRCEPDSRRVASDADVADRRVLTAGHARTGDHTGWAMARSPTRRTT